MYRRRIKSYRTTKRRFRITKVKRFMRKGKFKGYGYNYKRYGRWY